MIYNSLDKFLTIAPIDQELFIFDFDGTLCCAKYAYNGIVDITLDKESLIIRDSQNSPYINGIVKPSLIGKWLADSNIKYFVVCTGSLGSDATVLAKKQWLNSIFPDKDILYISTFSFFDKFDDLNTLCNTFKNCVVVDDNLEALLDLEKKGLKCDLIHTSTFEVDYLDNI